MNAIIRLAIGTACAAVLPLAAQAQETLNVGIEVPVSVANVPMLMAVDRLNDEGFEAKTVEFQSPETMTLALQQGEIDIIGTSVGTGFAAREAGLDALFIIGLAKSDFQMVAKAGLDTCESLDGHNVAIHSYEGTTGTMTTQWLESACPEAKPKIMVVPGSENRLAGMLAGQIDASAIDSQAAMQLMSEREGEFEMIPSFSEDAILASAYIARTAWTEKNHDLAMKLGATYKAIIDEITADPQILVDETIARVDDVDEETLTAVAKGWVERGVFVPVWGVQPDVVDHAIAFYGSSRDYEVLTSADVVATTEFVGTAD